MVHSGHQGSISYKAVSLKREIYAKDCSESTGHREEIRCNEERESETQGG